MFIVAAMMTVAACSEPEVVPKATKPAGTSHNQIGTRVFHTEVTTWDRPDGSPYVGVVSTIPDFDLWDSRITVIGNNMTANVDNYLDVAKLTYITYYGSMEGYFWASIENNILLLHFVGPTPDSTPPFPLTVKIVY